MRDRFVIMNNIGAPLSEILDGRVYDWYVGTERKLERQQSRMRRILTRRNMIATIVVFVLDI